MKQVQLRLTEDMAQSIDERAARVGLSRHAWLIAALSWALEQPVRRRVITTQQKV